MNITIRRTHFSSISTIGEMIVDGNPFAFTLEDTVRKEGDAKVYGKTAIPPGQYKCAVEYSDRFKNLMVRVLNVKDFAGILFHRGNVESDTYGCILIGSTPGIDTILDSTLAYAKFCRRVAAAVTNKEDINLEILNVRGTRGEMPVAA